MRDKGRDDAITRWPNDQVMEVIGGLSERTDFRTTQPPPKKKLTVPLTGGYAQPDVEQAFGIAAAAAASTLETNH